MRAGFIWERFTEEAGSGEGKSALGGIKTIAKIQEATQALAMCSGSEEVPKASSALFPIYEISSLQFCVF